jgi:hypothetical protein
MDCRRNEGAFPGLGGLGDLVFEYLADQSPKNQVVIRALRRFVKRVEPELSAAVKWGNGCGSAGKGMGP